MFEAADFIFTVCLNLFQGYCLQYFYGSFLEGRIKDKRRNGLAVAGLYAVFRIVPAWMGFPAEWDYKAAIGRLALSLGVLAVLAVGFYRAFCYITIFLVTAFQAVTDISRYGAVIVFGELGDGLLGIWNTCMENGMISSGDAYSAVVNAGLIGEWLLEYLAIILLVYLSLKKIAGDFREKDYCINRTELMFLLTPAAVGLTVCMLLRIIIITAEDGVPKILYDRYPVLIVVIPAILFLSLLSILYGVKLFQDMIHLNREKSSRIILEKQVESLQEHMDEMERVYSGIRSMKHDMKNTISVIWRLAVRKDGEENRELQAYLSEMNRTLESLEIRFKTGNTVVDTLLNMKYHEAVREMPDLNMDADKLMLPQGLKIRSYDIGIILGNALDNAVEACRKLKRKEQSADVFIRLCSLQKGNLLILKLENSFDGRLMKKRPNGLPATDKPDRASHGIGLANIKNTAEKYQGAMDFKIGGRVFILSVMMKNERRMEDGFWSD